MFSFSLSSAAPQEKPLSTEAREEAKLAFAQQAKAFLAQERAEAELILSADKGAKKRGGMETARHLSDAQDAVIRALFTFVTTHLYPVNNPSAGEKIAIVAVGGYGRGTLAPGSDVDLLFLLPVSTAWGESVAEAMLYPLWDLGLKIGHATRTIEESLRAAKDDLTIRTALLESRLISGDEALFNDFLHEYDTKVIAKTGRDFVLAKLKERDERILRAGQSRYLVEPNIKEGKGGLRDVQTLFWIVRYVYRVKNEEELLNSQLFTKREIGLLKRCEEFLWRVRCHLHFAARRADERLSFEMQRIVADRMRYQDRPPL